jgi:hypothetical protein
MKNVARTICAAVFFVGLLIFSQAQINNSNNDDKTDIEPARPYVIKYIHYRISPDASKKITGQSTAYVKANGESRSIFYGPDGPKGDNPLSKYSNESTIYAVLGDGLYAKEAGSNVLTYSSPSADKKMLEHFRSHEVLKNQRDFVRIDKVAGLKVYVQRHEMKDPTNPMEWVENSYSPRTGWGALRGVVHFRDGSEIWTEAVSVEFKEVPEDLNDDLKDLPVKNIEDKKP